MKYYIPSNLMSSRGSVSVTSIKGIAVLKLMTNKRIPRSQIGMHISTWSWDWNAPYSTIADWNVHFYMIVRLECTLFYDRRLECTFLHDREIGMHLILRSIGHCFSIIATHLLNGCCSMLIYNYVLALGPLLTFTASRTFSYTEKKILW